jgi:hypothetical protein
MLSRACEDGEGPPPRWGSHFELVCDHLRLDGPFGVLRQPRDHNASSLVEEFHGISEHSRSRDLSITALSQQHKVQSVPIVHHRLCRRLRTSNCALTFGFV